MPQIRKLAFAIKNSSTIALPQWYRILEDLSLEARLIPRDVRTCWNATYNMLDFAYQYKKAINKITDIREMKLCAYEIEVHEWEVVQQLRDLLKVLFLIVSNVRRLTLHSFLRFSRMPRCSSCGVAYLASPPSSRPWTTLMNIWLRQPSATSTTLQSGLPLCSGRKLSTGIITGQTRRSCIKSQ